MARTLYIRVTTSFWKYSAVGAVVPMLVVAAPMHAAAGEGEVLGRGVVEAGCRAGDGAREARHAARAGLDPVVLAGDLRVRRVLDQDGLARAGDDVVVGLDAHLGAVRVRDVEEGGVGAGADHGVVDAVIDRS